MHNWHKVFLKKFQLNLNRRTCQPTAFPSSYFQATTKKQLKVRLRIGKK